VLISGAQIGRQIAAQIASQTKGMDAQTLCDQPIADAESRVIAADRWPVRCVCYIIPYRSLEVKHEFRRQHPCLSDGQPDREMPRLHQGSRRPARLRRIRRSFQHAMADDRGGEGQGPVGDEGLPPPTGFDIDNHSIAIIAAYFTGIGITLG